MALLAVRLRLSSSPLLTPFGLDQVLALAGCIVCVCETQACGCDDGAQTPSGVKRKACPTRRIVEQRAAADLIIGKRDARSVRISLASRAIVEIVEIARSGAAGTDPQGLPAGTVGCIGNAMADGIDELALSVIRVENEAVAVPQRINLRDQVIAEVEYTSVDLNKRIDCPNQIARSIISIAGTRAQGIGGGNEPAIEVIEPSRDRADRVCGRDQPPIGVIREADAVAEGVDLDFEPVYIVMERRRDMAQRIHHAQALAIDVVRIAGSRPE
jgi:hypothetical protein